MYDKADQDKVASEITSLKRELMSRCAECDANSNWRSFSAEENTGKKYHRLAKKAKPHKRDQHWRSYRKIKSDVKTEIHQAHDHYINSLFEDDSGKPSKQLWKSIKVKKRDQVGPPSQREEW